MSFNGWKNWETWNVALWIGNDEGLYREARSCVDYAQFTERMRDCESKETPDGCAWDSGELDVDSLDEMITEL